jgi:cysteine desulfurase
MLYFDHSATTPIRPEVQQLLREIEAEHFGNPSSVHRFGQKARSLVESARNQVAAAIGCRPGEILFTSGGTEANNLVLWNLIHGKKQHVVTSAVEHPAILKVLKRLKALGLTYTAVPVNRQGRVDPDDIRRAIRPDTGLITVMTANNEVGTIQPVAEIARIAREYGIPYHTDAVQALGKIPVSVTELGVDLLSLSAHKFYGPKGVGILYVKQGTPLQPLIIGGGQERRLRAGTENVAGIAGLGLAAELAAAQVQENQRHLESLAQQFKSALTQTYPAAVFNGDPDQQLPGLVSVTLPAVTNDVVLIQLDLQGIAVSSGSACSSGTVEPSRVLKAMHVSDEDNIRTLRISFGKDNTPEEVQVLVEALEAILTVSRRGR